MVLLVGCSEAQAQRCFSCLLRIYFEGCFHLDRPGYLQCDPIVEVSESDERQDGWHPCSGTAWAALGFPQCHEPRPDPMWRLRKTARLKQIENGLVAVVV